MKIDRGNNQTNRNSSIDFFYIPPYSENTPEGRKTTKLEQILLNGNNICMVMNV